MNPAVWFIVYSSFIAKICCADDVDMSVNATWDNASTLHETLFTNYRNDVRPVLDYSKAVQVNITFSLISVNDIDEVSGTMSFSSFIYAFWIDEKMTWDRATYGIPYTILPYDKVWTPNLVVVNPGGQMKKLGDDYTQVRYVFDGRAIWQPPIIMSTVCALNITYYPFDIQTCHVTIMSWMTIPSEVLLATPTVDADMTYFQKNGEWDVKSVKASSAQTDLYSYSTFTFELERKPIFHIINIILPIVFLGVVNPLVFVLPVECGERVSYAITMLLSFAVFMTLVSDKMPETSDPQAIISVYLILMMVYSVMIMLLAILTLRLHFKSDTKRVPFYVRKIMMVITCGICCREKAVVPSGTHNSHGKGIPENGGLNTNRGQELKNGDTGYFINAEIGNVTQFGDWKSVALALDVILFVSSVVVFLCLTIAFLVSIGTRQGNTP